MGRIVSTEPTENNEVRNLIVFTVRLIGVKDVLGKDGNGYLVWRRGYSRAKC